MPVEYEFRKHWYDDIENVEKRKEFIAINVINIVNVRTHLAERIKCQEINDNGETYYACKRIHGLLGSTDVEKAKQAKSREQH